MEKKKGNLNVYNTYDAGSVICTDSGTDKINKRKNEEREKDWYKRLVAEKKREAEKAIKDKDELYEKALKKTFEQGVTFKKFSSRTPDFNKLGEDKIDSYRRLFANEMREEMVKVLNI